MTAAPPPGFTPTPAYRSGVLTPVLAHLLAARRGGARVFGVYGPQGSGKSTLAAALANALAEAEGIRAVALSLDDYYLPRAERMALAETVHPLFETRGPPGTHDVARLRADLGRLRGLGAGEAVLVPRFDKSVDDRAPEDERVEGPIDAVLLEGWCLAVPPEPADRLAAPVNALERERDADAAFRTAINQRLASDYADLAGDLDHLTALTVPSFDATRAHRHQQEAALRAATGGGMTEAQVDAFMDGFERITRWAAESLPGRADLHVALDAARRPVVPIGPPPATA